MENSVYYHVGWMMGVEMTHQMPCISVENHNGVVTQVTIGEADKYNALSDGDDFKEYRKFARELKKKYLPDHILYYFYSHDSYFIEENLKEIKRGIIGALWDYDFSDYFCKPDEIELITDKCAFKIPLAIHDED